MKIENLIQTANDLQKIILKNKIIGDRAKKNRIYQYETIRHAFSMLDDCQTDLLSIQDIMQNKGLRYPHFYNTLCVQLKNFLANITCVIHIIETEKTDLFNNLTNEKAELLTELKKLQQSTNEYTSNYILQTENFLQNKSLLIAELKKCHIQLKDINQAPKQTYIPDKKNDESYYLQTTTHPEKNHEPLAESDNHPKTTNVPQDPKKASSGTNHWTISKIFNYIKTFIISITKTIYAFFNQPLQRIFIKSQCTAIKQNDPSKSLSSTQVQTNSGSNMSVARTDRASTIASQSDTINKTTC